MTKKRCRHKPEQIIASSMRATASSLLARTSTRCRHLEIAGSTWNRWLAQYGGMKANDAKRLRSATDLVGGYRA